MEFIKREKKFVAIVAGTVLLVLALQALAVSSVQTDGDRALSRARGAWLDWGDRLKETFESIKGTRDEPYNIEKLARWYDRRLDDLHDEKARLLSALQWDPGPDFAIVDPEEGESAGIGFWTRQVTDRLMRKPGGLLWLWNESTRAGDYGFARFDSADKLGLPLDSPNLLDEMDAPIYLAEAPAWAGLVEAPEEADSPRGRFGRRPGRRPEPAGEPTPEEREHKRRLEARAEAKLRMLLLSIGVKVIEAGRAAGVERLAAMQFVRRDGHLEARFQVKEDLPSFYRPVCLEVDVRADERSLAAFVDNCVSPGFGGSGNRFLALDRLLLDAEECLEEAPKDQLVTARITLVAWLLSPDSEFSVEREDDRRSRFMYSRRRR